MWGPNILGLYYIIVYNGKDNHWHAMASLTPYIVLPLFATQKVTLKMKTSQENRERKDNNRSEHHTSRTKKKTTLWVLRQRWNRPSKRKQPQKTIIHQGEKQQPRSTSPQSQRKHSTQPEILSQDEQDHKSQTSTKKPPSSRGRSRHCSRTPSPHQRKSRCRKPR